MTPPVFLAEPGALGADVVVLAGAEGHHAASVRRVRVGERVHVTDGDGTVVECVVTAVGAGRVDLRVQARRWLPPPQPRVVVVQAVPKGERGELAVAMLTEVGVDVVVPWTAERCVARWQGPRERKALQRWRVTARESAKQAHRPRVPEVADLASTADVVARIGIAKRSVLLTPEAPLPLTRVPVPPAGDVVLVVGPEGGISPAESAAFAGAGAVPARLGPTVLRTSTAGVVAVAVALANLDRC